MAENVSETEQDQNKYLAQRVESPLVSRLTLGLGSLITLITITWAIDFWLNLGFTWFDEQAMVACLGLSLGVVFIRYPMKLGTERHSVPWYDYVFALLGMGGALYFILIFDSVADNPFVMRPKTFVIGLLLVPLVWEGLRRTAGWSLTIVFSVFIAYGFVGHLMPGMLRGVEQQNVDLISFLATSEVALIGLPLKIIVLTVVLFIWMGQMLLYTGASEWFTDLSAAMMGRSRGGSAKIAVVASSLFGSISGSAVSNVASTGVITIPLMRKAGYDAKTAAAIEAVASTGGQIMPPIMGAAAFLMAEILELAYTEIILAALIPSLLYYFAVFVQTDLEAAKNGIAALPKDRIPPMLRVMKEGWFFIVPYVVLIYALFTMNMAPQQAAFWAAVSVGLVSLLFGYKKARITPKQFLSTFSGCGRMSVDIIIIGAMAGVIIGILDKTGLGQSLTLILAMVGENNLWLLLILTALISILLGMGMPTSAIYLLLATMIAPSLIKLGVDPIAAHLFVLYFGLMSMITPPVAIAAFAAASLAGANPLATGITAVRLGWIAYVIPFVFVFSPELLMHGEPLYIVLTLVAALAGVWLGSAGILGYFLERLNAMQRVAFMLSGLALLLPLHLIEGGVALRIGGGVLGAFLVGREILLRRRGRTAATG